MKRCNPNARARCPDGKNCELYAEFADGSWCDTFNGITLKQPRTNADCIRAMSDEELAKFLNVAGCPCPEKDCRPTCEVCIEEWLQQPAEEAAEDGN